MGTIPLMAKLGRRYGRFIAPHPRHKNRRTPAPIDPNPPCGYCTGNGCCVMGGWKMIACDEMSVTAGSVAVMVPSDLQHRIAPPLPQVLAELQKNVFKGERVRTMMERSG